MSSRIYNDVHSSDEKRQAAIELVRLAAELDQRAPAQSKPAEAQRLAERPTIDKELALDAAVLTPRIDEDPAVPVPLDKEDAGGVSPLRSAATQIRFSPTDIFRSVINVFTSFTAILGIQLQTVQATSESAAARRDRNREEDERKREEDQLDTPVKVQVNTTQHEQITAQGRYVDIVTMTSQSDAAGRSASSQVRGWFEPE